MTKQHFTTAENQVVVPMGQGRRLPRWLFFRLLGLVYVMAFWSLWSQMDGLIGPDGIVPADLKMKRFEDILAANNDLSWWNYPTLSWFLGAQLGTLNILCGTGLALGIGLMLGIWPRGLLFGLWLLYLSFFTLGSPFLNFQWDILLLETTILAILYAPSGLKPRLADSREPSAVSVWLIRLLLFKLMLSSGIVKLQSGDASWNDLTALNYHFWTQPIPHQIAWYVHSLGDVFRQGGVLFNHLVELFVPWLILFNPRGWRLLIWFGLCVALLVIGLGEYSLLHVAIAGLGAAVLGGRITTGRADASPSRTPAAVFIIALMVTVGVSGNYGFFNLLTITLAMVCLDDRCVYRFTPNRILSRLPDRSTPTRPCGRLWHCVVIPAAVVLIALNSLQLLDLMSREQIRSAVARVQEDRADTMDQAVNWLMETRRSVRTVTGPFASVNGYGLFRTMTKERAELLVEGSADGKAWKRYRFKYKPSRADDPLVYAGFHMPRLDWQMWFAALRRSCSTRWFFGFLESLVDGSKATLGLLAHNPFPNGRPRFVRVRRVAAQFTTPEERDRTGHVWKFSPLSDYCPVIPAERFKSLRTFRKPLRRRPE